MTKKYFYPFIILIPFFFHSVVAAKGAYKQRIDLLEKKFENAGHNSSADVNGKLISAHVCAVEALSLCALLEQTSEVKELLAKRIDQFHSAFKTSKRYEEKLLSASTGFYNMILMLGNIRCSGTLYMRPLREIDAKTSRIGKNDSLDLLTKCALIHSEAFKLVSLFTIAADTIGKYKNAIENTGKAFDEAGKKISRPEGGIALAAYQTAKMLDIFIRLRFPHASADLGVLNKELNQPARTVNERMAAGFSGVFRAAIVLARQLDQR